MTTTIPGVEKRLQDRYERLVQEHVGHAHAVAPGPRQLPDESSAKAAAMAAWRFSSNPRTTFTTLDAPLLKAAADLAALHCQNFALVPVDWSWLDYTRHHTKTDRVLGQGGLLGYKLLSALLISDLDGQPLAPLGAQLLTRKGVLSSRFDKRQRFATALDDLTPLMQFIPSLPLGKRPVFIIDAEADSGQQVEHWQQEDGASVLKRLLVASMACVLAWRLGHSTAPQAQEARRVVSDAAERPAGGARQGLHAGGAAGGNLGAAGDGDAAGAVPCRPTAADGRLRPQRLHPDQRHLGATPKFRLKPLQGLVEIAQCVRIWQTGPRSQSDGGR
jgi:hypothetical protein